MTTTGDIISGAFARLRRDGLALAIPLVFGMIGAWIVSGIITFVVGFVGVFALGDNLSLLSALVFLVAMLTSSALFTAVVGSQIRSAMAEGSEHLREYGIACIPTGIAASGVLVVASLSGGPLVASLAAIPVMWATVLAMVDIGADGSGSGFGAALRVATTTPVQLLAVVGIGFAIDVVMAIASLVFVPAGWAVLPVSILIRIYLAIELYGASHELPSERRRRESEEYGLERSEGRAHVPKWMQEEDPSTGSPDEPAAVAPFQLVHGGAASSMVAGSVVPVPAAGGHVVLSQESPYGFGGWVPHAEGGVLTVLLPAGWNPVDMPAAACDSSGAWFSLPATPGGYAATLGAGPWFVAVHGAPAGTSVAWSVAGGGGLAVAA